MDNPPDYIARNAFEREQLNALAARLSDEDLCRSVGGGWTVASVLVHTAFWDYWQLAFLKACRQHSVKDARTDSDAANEAVQALSAAIAPRAAIGLALAAAEAVDQEIERLPPELAAELEARGFPRAIRRYQHRRDHIDQIERALN